MPYAAVGWLSRGPGPLFLQSLRKGWCRRTDTGALHRIFPLAGGRRCRGIRGDRQGNRITFGGRPCAGFPSRKPGIAWRKIVGNILGSKMPIAGSPSALRASACIVGSGGEAVFQKLGARSLARQRYFFGGTLPGVDRQLDGMPPSSRGLFGIGC